MLDVSLPDISLPDISLLDISVAFSPHAGRVDEVTIRLAPASTVGDAVARSGLQHRHPGFDLKSLPAGVWGVLRPPGHVLRDADRVEIYRPLQVDPKEARRLRDKAKAGRTDAVGRRGQVSGSR